MLLAYRHNFVSNKGASNLQVSNTNLNPFIMESRPNNKIIVELIASDLLLGKMMLGLHRLNIDASAYCLNLSQVVFRLMGFTEHQQTEELYDLYTGLCVKALDFGINIHDSKALELLATNIYKTLNDKLVGDRMEPQNLLVSI